MGKYHVVSKPALFSVLDNWVLSFAKDGMQQWGWLCDAQHCCQGCRSDTVLLFVTVLERLLHFSLKGFIYLLVSHIKCLCVAVRQHNINFDE